MKILAVDTATNSLSVAISDDDCLISEQTFARNESHSKHIQRTIIDVVKNTGLDISDIDGFAVSRGPGSFTGLRIGVSAVKGLAYGIDRPVVSLSSLDALVHPLFGSSLSVCPMIDARRGEVYYSLYSFEAGGMSEKTEERVDKPESIPVGGSPVVFVGTGVMAYKTVLEKTFREKAVFAPFELNRIRAGTLACMALERFENGDTDDLCGFKPHYIRKSDAEINFRK